MSPTRDDVRRWLEIGKEEGCTHVLIVYDKLANHYFPVHVDRASAGTNAMVSQYSDSAHRVMEVYALHLDIESQLKEQRAWHLEGENDVKNEESKTQIETKIVRNAWQGRWEAGMLSIAADSEADVCRFYCDGISKHNLVVLRDLLNQVICDLARLEAGK